jgi:hypothetical protein
MGDLKLGDPEGAVREDSRQFRFHIAHITEASANI